MIDSKSILGTIATVLLSIVSDVTKSDATFLLFVGISVTTITYNIVKIKNEYRNKKA